MKINKLYIVCAFFIVIAAAACSEMDATYSDFIKNGPIVYLQKVDTAIIQSGRNRLKISLPALYDARVEYTAIKWANKTKRVDVPVVYGEPTEVILDNMDEALYDFSFVNFNGDSLYSIPTSFSGEVYGSSYESFLQNRKIESVTINEIERTATIKFPVLSDSTNVGMQIQWERNGETTTTIFANTPDDSIVVENFGVRDFEYRSLYKPLSNAIDTFYAAWTPYHITVTTKVLLDRSNWEVTPSQNPLPTDGKGNYIKNLTDGDFNTFMSMVKPGKTSGGVTVGANEPVYFIVDLGSIQKFDYIVWEHRNDTQTGLRVQEASFYGSNDGITFTEIMTNVPIPGSLTSSVYKGTIDLPSSEYRYVKVLYTAWDTKNNSSMQIGEFWLGVTEVD